MANEVKREWKASRRIRTWLRPLASRRHANVTINVVTAGSMPDKDAARRAIECEIQRALTVPHGRYRR